MLVGMAEGHRVDVAEMSSSAPVVRAAGFFDIGFRVSNPATDSEVTVKNTSPNRLTGSLSPGAGVPPESVSVDAGATYQRPVNGERVHMLTLSLTAGKSGGAAMAMVSVVNGVNMPTPDDPTGEGFNGASIHAAAMWPD